MFRHKHALDFMEAGGDIKELQFNLGHSSVKTTELYLQELGIDINRTINNISPLERKLINNIDKRLPNIDRIKMS